MKYTNSTIPLTNSHDCLRADAHGDSVKASWYQNYTIVRWIARKRKIAERKRLLRAANRAYRRRNGMTLRYS